MSQHDHSEATAAALKMFWAWLFVGVSQMTPFQVVQLIAALAATVYSVTQTYLLWKHRHTRK